MPTANALAPSQDRVRIFPKHLENINLVLGIGFTLACFLTWSLGVPFNPQSYYGPFEALILNVFLLNITHNSFNFVLPLLIPEFRPWVKEEKPHGLSVTKWSVVVFLLINLILFSSFYATKQLNHRFLGWALMGVLVDCWSIRHVLGQTYGLSRMYDFAHQTVHGPASGTTERSIQRQRFLLWRIFYPLLIFKAAIVYWLQDQAFSAFVTYWSLLSIPVALAIVFFAWREQGGTKSNKWIYLCRLLPYCCFGIRNPFPLYANMILHSYEFTVIGGQMLHSSLNEDKFNAFARRRFWLASSFIILLVVGFSLCRYFIYGPYLTNLFPRWKILIEVIGVFSTSISLMHYYLDEVMFKFSHASIRRHVMPLLRW